MKLNKYGVIGYPIAHSQSPFIHNSFARSCSININYEKFAVPNAQLEDFLINFRKNNGKGLNITSPLKSSIKNLCDCLTERAKFAESVNTIYWDNNNQLIGDTTDGIGLVKDWQRLGLTWQGKSILVLGAGAVVKGVLASLFISGKIPKEIFIANRTISKAFAITKSFANVKFCEFTDLTKIKPDIVLQATSIGQQDLSLPLPKNLCWENAYCYDLNYGKPFYNFSYQAKKLGAKRIVSGLGMLVMQASESFYLWHKINVTQETIENLISTYKTEY